MLLDDGRVRRVNGRKAMAVVVRNRELAGVSANPATVPAAGTWLDGKLAVAGPFTANAGFVGFQAQDTVASGTKWFVWATPPVLESEAAPTTQFMVSDVTRCEVNIILFVYQMKG